MQAKDIPVLKQKVLDMIPITQSDACKNLDIDHRDGSKLISIMIGENLIRRTRSEKTFLLERPNGNGKEESENTSLEEKKTKKEKPEKEKPEKEKESDKSGETKQKVKYDPAIKQKVLDMLPVIQSDIWKNLGIDRRAGSRLVSKMVKEGLIKRTKSDSTFLLEKLNGDGKKKDDMSRFAHLLSKDGKFSVCCGCERVCNPTVCTLLTEWLL